jgi:hypothetical protein
MLICTYKIDHLLTEQERDRRSSTKYRAPFHVIGASPTNILVDTHVPSMFWPIYQQLFANVAEHLHVDMSIIDYNYVRLSRCIDIWANERVYRFNKFLHEVTLDQIEYSIALEFYLQIDGKRASERAISFHSFVKLVSFIEFVF